MPVKHIPVLNKEYVEKANIPTFVLDEAAKLVQWSQSAELLFGYTMNDFSDDDHTLTESLFSQLSLNDLTKVINSTKIVQFNNVPLYTKDEAPLKLTLISTPCIFEDQKAVVIFCIEVDSVKNFHEEYAELVDLKNGLLSTFMFITLDQEGFITYCNPQFLKVGHWTPKRILNKTFWQISASDKNSKELADKIWNTLNSGESWDGEVLRTTKDGQTYWVHSTAIPIGDDENRYFALIEKEITKEKLIQLQLEKIAYIDTETGFMNSHRLEQVVKDMIEERRHFSLVYISIDQFYTLKDLPNIDLQPNLIVEFAKRMKMYFQDSSMARVNENDFVVLTPLSEWFIQGFLSYLKQNPIYVGNVTVPISISGGITRFPENQSTFAQLMKASHATIKNVREAGGNNIVSLSGHIHKALNRKSLIEKRLLLALDKRNLKVLYQPQLDVHTNKFVAVEAFVRWEDEEAGIVPPAELIPIAEESGLINQIGMFILEQACTQAVAWKKAGIPLKVSINSSVREFRDKNMAQSILETLEATNCPSHLIQIEITEKFALEAESEKSIIKQMLQLEKEGITFALDDFGTGYASFRYMQLLPIETLKIAPTFVHTATSSKKTQQLINGMVQLGKSMDLKVLAEGIETEEQQQILQNCGCNLMQGYHIFKPSTVKEITALLKK